jgi:hypothetical protein
MQNVCVHILSETLKRNHSYNLGADGWIILNWILKKQNVRTLLRFMQLRMRFSDVLF